MLVTVDLESIEQAKKLLAVAVFAFLQEVLHARQQLLVKHFTVEDGGLALRRCFTRT